MLKTMEEVAAIRKKYPVGTHIVVDHMGDDDPAPIKDGTRGTVKHVDDIGTLHCDFEDGRQLGVVIGVDRFHVVKTAKA